MTWTPMNCTGSQQGFWESCTSRNTANLDPKGQRHEPPCFYRVGLLPRDKGQSHTPSGTSWGHSIQPKRIILKPLNLTAFALLAFRLGWELGPRFLCDFSPLERECMLDACPTMVFCKQVTFCLVSQAHNWRAILLQNKSYPESYPPKSNVI